MFEAAELGRTLSKTDFKQAEPELHHRLLQLQQRLRQTQRSLIIIVAGVEGAGKGEVVDRLNRWFDIRDVETHAFWDETDEEKQRPRYWRFWRCLPGRGGVAIMFGSWYTQPIVDAALGRTDEADLDQELTRIAELEQTLARDGTIFVKLWFHLPKKVQQQRLSEEAKVSKLKKSPLLKSFSKSYDAFVGVSERALRLTDSGSSPWHIIESSDLRYRDVAMGSILVRTLEEELDADEHNAESKQSRQAGPEEGKDDGGSGANGEDVIASVLSAQKARSTVLDNVDLSQALTESTYGKQLPALQERLHQLAWQMFENRRNTVMVFEGWDGAGKGSAIRRVTAAIDARLYRVIPIAAPTDEEFAHHYLWRFWRHVPRAGHMTIYDRSWYGRVLVERVEDFASKPEWLRSYQEINDFEEQLVAHGTVLFKFWVHVDKDEQLARFKEREKDPRKQHKITDEDWRNREKWEAYEEAINDMVSHTSTSRTPWTLVAGNDKKFARVQILETICERLQQNLDSMNNKTD